MTQSLDRPTDRSSESVGELVKDASGQISELVRQEMRLAQAEMKQKGKRFGLGGGMFSGAALAGFFALAALLTAAIVALALVLPLWASALIVAGVLLVIAGALAAMGRQEFRKAVPPAPKKAIEGMRADAAEIRERVHR